MVLTLEKIKAREGGKIFKRSRVRKRRSVIMSARSAFVIFSEIY